MVIVATERYFNICKPFHKNLVITFMIKIIPFMGDGISDYFWLRKEPEKSMLTVKLI